MNTALSVIFAMLTIAFVVTLPALVLAAVLAVRAARKDRW